MSEPSRSSLALARKWRPRSFATLVGQEHVVRALTHALVTRRVHHAYLLTGTRGVGKTTIARILAKALNCEVRGLGHAPDAEPCGACRACVEIDAQRFPDYIELDAASNRGVDEMTQLLENAVYAPVAGRYKVYVIDEVHMLSAHAFNAMLKTLEEPPGHVVFILATTDPQKVPVTVLSRCLQFSLKNMPPPAIALHLAHVLRAEQVEFEAPALDAIGRAAAGSMRDALSLLDQAIAFGAGRVAEADVGQMLGLVDRASLSHILDALAGGDARAALAVADDMAARGLSFAQALADLSVLLHRIALAQIGAAGDAAFDAQALARWAAAFDPLDLQVYYQIALHAGRDLPLAPDEHTGFSMALLRLFAFRPDGRDSTGDAHASTGAHAPAPVSAGSGSSAPTPADRRASLPARPVRLPDRTPFRPVAEPAAVNDPVAAGDPAAAKDATAIEQPAAAERPVAVERPAQVEDPAPIEASASSPMAALRAALARPRRPAGSPGAVNRAAESTWHEAPSQPVGIATPRSVPGSRDDEPVEARSVEARSPEALPLEPSSSDQPSLEARSSQPPPQADAFDGDWPRLAASLDAAGLVREFFLQSELLAHCDDEFRVRVPIRSLAEGATVAKAREILARRLGPGVRLTVETGAVRGTTAAAIASRHDAERQQQAVEAIRADPFVRTLLADFGGTIVPGSVRPH